MPISNDTAPLAQFLAGQAVRAQEFLGSHCTRRTVRLAVPRLGSSCSGRRRNGRLQRLG